MDEILDSESKKVIGDLELRIQSLANEIAQNVTKPHIRKRLLRQIFELDRQRDEKIIGRYKQIINNLQVDITKNISKLIDNSGIESLLNENINQIIIEFMPGDLEPVVILSFSKTKYA